MTLKDARLAALADSGNVARFVSFGPGPIPVLRHDRVDPPDRASTRAAAQPVTTPGSDDDVHVHVARMLEAAGSVNVRTFLPDRDKGCPFHYGLTTLDAATSTVRAAAADGYYTIVNETVDVADGGVSGVSLGGAVEFAPDDTPRAVEKPGTVALTYELGMRLLQTVYGFHPDVPAEPGKRVEFSVHPRRVGWRQTHTLLWETETVEPVALEPTVRWPNRFSRHLGDKAFGLLIADLLDLPVPRTTTISRRVAPFTFGRPTGTAETWTRTCPREQAPGKFTTTDGWADPFALLAAEDPSSTAIASVLAQEAVDAAWSGATIPTAGDAPDHVEGVRGSGDAFMLGTRRPEPLPSELVNDVRLLAARARKTLGPVRLEWAHDGRIAWILQLHLATHFFQGEAVLSPGSADEWVEFDAADGLEALREVVMRAASDGLGVLVRGSVGITSHVGDLLRKARVPARLATDV